MGGNVRDVEQVARRLAAGLRARGVSAGDVVAFQLPNWVEAATTFWASAFLGAVLVPIVHFYGRKELAHILSSAKPRVFITTDEFGRMTDQPDLCSDIPLVGLVGRDFDDLPADEAMAGTIPADPAGPALIAFTSGTTSAPKGVIHSPAAACRPDPVDWRQPADRDTGRPLHRNAGRCKVQKRLVREGLR